MPSDYPSADAHRRAPATRRFAENVTDAKEFRKQVANDPALKRFAELSARLGRSAPEQQPVEPDEQEEPKPEGSLSLLSRKPKETRDKREGTDTALDFIGNLSPAFVSLAETGIENALDGRSPVEAFQFLRDNAEESPFGPIDAGMPVTDCLSSLMAQHARYIAMIGLLVAIDQHGAEW